MERNKFVPFPPEIANQYKNVESASFMGILPEINRYDSFSLLCILVVFNACQCLFVCL